MTHFSFSSIGSHPVRLAEACADSMGWLRAARSREADHLKHVVKKKQGFEATLKQSI